MFSSGCPYLRDYIFGLCLIFLGQNKKKIVTRNVERRKQQKTKVTENKESI